MCRIKGEKNGESKEEEEGWCWVKARKKEGQIRRRKKKQLVLSSSRCLKFIRRSVYLLKIRNPPPLPFCFPRTLPRRGRALSRKIKLLVALFSRDGPTRFISARFLHPGTVESRIDTLETRGFFCGCVAKAPRGCRRHARPKCGSKRPFDMLISRLLPFAISITRRFLAAIRNVNSRTTLCQAIGAGCFKSSPPSANHRVD